jgi:hypothetical protein
MDFRLFRKTDKGRAEIAQRSGTLPNALRSVLITINGRDDVNTLAQSRGLSGVGEHLAALLMHGLIEEVTQPGAAPAAVAAPPPRPVAAAAPPPPPVPEAPPPASLETHQQRLLSCLTLHFGADTSFVARAMLAARDVIEFNGALGAIESELAVYMGRKQAVRLLAEFRIVSI